MNTTIQKWGNSLAVRIPRSVAKDSHLHQGSVVDIVLIGGKIVVKPQRQQSYTLKQLLRGVTSRNRHIEQDWGAQAGQEAW